MTRTERSERCDRCRWWDVQTGVEAIPDPDDPNQVGGECRRSAPSTTALLAILAHGRQAGSESPQWPMNLAASWPTTCPQDFCGEFEPTEQDAVKVRADLGNTGKDWPDVSLPGFMCLERRPAFICWVCFGATMSVIDSDRRPSRYSRNALRATMGRCFRPRWKRTSRGNVAPGLPRTRAQGLAHGEPRGHAARGSKRGLRLAGYRPW